MSQRKRLFLILLLGLLTVSGVNPRAIKAERIAAFLREEAGDSPIERETWFYTQRQSFGRHTAVSLAGRRLHALDSLSVALERRTIRETVLKEGGWRSTGPTPILAPAAYRQGPSAGRVLALAVHPTRAGVVYLGSAQGGIWKSNNRGQSWTPLSDNECSLAISAIVIDPVNPRIIYAGTGEEITSNRAVSNGYFGCGLLRSIDGGASWQRFEFQSTCPYECIPEVTDIAIDPFTAGSTNSTVIYVATRDGLMRSDTSGADLVPIKSGQAWSVLADRQQPGLVYAAFSGFHSGGGIFKSLDAGTTWTALPGLTDDIERIAMARSNSSPNIFYAAVATSGEGFRAGHALRLYTSIDRGETWKELIPTIASGAGTDDIYNLPWCSSYCSYALAIGVDPVDPKIVYFGGVFLTKSVDGGKTWRGMNFGSDNIGIHVDIHAIIADRLNRLWVETDGGVYYTDDRGSSWKSANTSLSLTQFSPGISVSSSSSGALALGGTQDNGTLLFSGKPAWLVIGGGDGGSTAINPADKRIFYFETQWEKGLGNGPYKSVNGGRSFTSSGKNINPNQGGIFLPPLILSESDPQRLLFGVATLYLSENGAKTWTPVLSGVGIFNALAFSSTGGFAYASTTGGRLFMSSDSGRTWVEKTGNAPRRITDLAVDPQNPRRIYAAGFGFGDPRTYRMDENGNWADISANLPDIFAGSIAAFECGGVRRLYLGTDIGVFVSEDDGQSWNTAQTGIPAASAIVDLKFNPATGTLWAATYGRGMYVLDLGCPQ